MGLKVGDTVTRMLAGRIAHELVVTALSDTEIECGDYTFNRATGLETDADLGWDGVTRTGSYLVEVYKHGQPTYGHYRR